MRAKMEGSAIRIGGTLPDYLQNLRRYLSTRRPRAAIKLFEKILARNYAPKGVDLADWLTTSIGREGLSRLTLAYATASCSLCNKGMHTCVNCHGSGRAEHGIICRSCLGMKMEPCGRCHGSGLSSYGMCPDDLRPLVLSYRLCIATNEMTKLTPEGSWVPEMTMEACLLRVANLNKLAGLLEGAAIEVTGQQARGLISPARLERVKTRIGKTYKMLERALRGTLERVAEISPANSKDSSPDLLFYNWLAHSDKFEGTLLQHDCASRMASRTTA